MIHPFKGRVTDLQRPVKIYRNSTDRTGERSFSIVQRGLVVGHTSDLIIRNASFVIHRAAQERTKRTGQKSPHAFIVGTVVDHMPPEDRYMVAKRIRYLPYECDDFFVDDHLPVLFAAWVHLSGEAVIGANP